MNALIRKELRFTAQPISYLFMAFSLMTLLPGYPILVGTFFLGLGLFQSFLAAREQNDLLYTVLLPIRKRDAVTARFVHAAVVELGAFLLCAALTAVRMTLLRGAAVYRENAMMNANLVYLGWVLLLDAALNVLLVGGFFRTGWNLGGPFLRFGAAALLLIAAAETLHHLPGLGFLNTPDEALGLQAAFLALCAAVYALATLLAHRTAQARFERLDL